MEREQFLARARIAAAARRLGDPGLVYEIPARPSTDLLAEFTVNFETTGGILHRGGDPDRTLQVVTDIVTGAGAESVLTWDAAHLPIPGLLTALAGRGVEQMRDTVPDDAQGRRQHQLGYFDCIAGITGAAAGLAESGSIVVSSGAGKPRMASLIPAVHVALLPVESLWASLDDWIAAHPEALDTAANWTVITGPSRTADIEQVLTRGVHGPKELHLVLTQT